MEAFGRSPRRPAGRSAWGGLIGPAVFIAGWATLGAMRAGYSPVADAISRLAEKGASTRPAMTGGFVVYGVGLISYGVALRRGTPGPAWLFAVGTGVATFGVAAAPLGTPTSGNIHAVFAGISYLGLAATPVAVSFAARAAGHRAPARVSQAIGAMTGGLLLASVVVAPGHGLLQRFGLTLGDLWIAVSAIGLLRDRRA